MKSLETRLSKIEPVLRAREERKLKDYLGALSDVELEIIIHHSGKEPDLQTIQALSDTELERLAYDCDTEPAGETIQQFKKILDTGS